MLVFESEKLLEKFTITELMSCVEREVQMRQKVYSKRVKNGTMTKKQARKEYDMMRAVWIILEKCQPPNQDELPL